MKIGMDMDDVIVDFARGFLDFYNQRFKANLKYEDWVAYSFCEAFDISQEKERELVSEFQQSERLDNLGLIVGAKETIENLAKKNSLVVITSRPLRLGEKTEKFIERYFPEVCFGVFYSDDFDKRHEIGKHGICKREGVKVYIEDNKDYALKCAKKGIKVFLLDKPWNKSYEIHENLIKVKNWDEILGKIEKIR